MNPYHVISYKLFAAFLILSCDLGVFSKRPPFPRVFFSQMKPYHVISYNLFTEFLILSYDLGVFSKRPPLPQSLDIVIRYIVWHHRVC